MIKMIISRFIFHALLFLLLNHQAAFGVSTFPFVQVEDTTANFDTTTPKVYTTTLNFDLQNNETTVDEAQLRQIITSFYQTQTNLSGFVQTSGFTFSQRNNNWILSISYDAEYNYQTLLQPIIYETDIVDNIGTAQVIQNGLTAVEPNFTSTYSLRSDITFTGSSICDLVGCPITSPYISCGEQLEGVTTYCRSICKLNFCFRGNCFHEAADEKPMCSCPVTSDVWFVGEHCELRLAIWIPWVFGAAVILILIIIVVLAVYLIGKIEISKDPETKMIPTFLIKKASTKSLDKAPIVENIIENTAKTPDVANSRPSNDNQYHNVWEAPSSNAASSRNLSTPSQHDQPPSEGRFTPALKPLKDEASLPSASENSRVSSLDIDLDNTVERTDDSEDDSGSSYSENMSIDLDEIKQMRLGKESNIMI